MTITPALRQRIIAAVATIPGLLLTWVTTAEIMESYDDPDWAGWGILATLSAFFLVFPVWCLIRPTLNRSAGALAILSFAIFFYFAKLIGRLFPDFFIAIGENEIVLRYGISAILTLVLHLVIRRWLAGPKPVAASK